MYNVKKVFSFRTPTPPRCVPVYFFLRALVCFVFLCVKIQNLLVMIDEAVDAAEDFTVDVVVTQFWVFIII